jgi:hypothetical protein
MEKLKTEQGQCVYTFGAQNFTSSDAIPEIVKEISIKLGLQASGPYTSKEISLDKELEKINTSEIWTLSE